MFGLIEFKSSIRSSCRLAVHHSVSILYEHKSVISRQKRTAFSTMRLMNINNNKEARYIAIWASYQIRKIAGCACAGNAGNVFPRRRFQRKPLVGDPGMHHGTCRDACRDRSSAVTGKTFPAFPAHAHPQLYVSGKRPILPSLRTRKALARYWSIYSLFSQTYIKTIYAKFCWISKKKK